MCGTRARPRSIAARRTQSARREWTFGQGGLESKRPRTTADCCDTYRDQNQETHRSDSEWELLMPTQRVHEYQSCCPPMSSPHCPHCMLPMRFECVVPHQRFGNLDERRFLCACGAKFIDVVVRLESVAVLVTPNSRSP